MLPGCSGGRLPGRSTKEEGREEGDVDEDGEEERIRGLKSSKKWLQESRRR